MLSLPSPVWLGLLASGMLPPPSPHTSGPPQTRRQRKSGRLLTAENKYDWHQTPVKSAAGSTNARRAMQPFLVLGALPAPRAQTSTPHRAQSEIRQWVCQRSERTTQVVCYQSKKYTQVSLDLRSEINTLVCYALVRKRARICSGVAALLLPVNCSSAASRCHATKKRQLCLPCQMKKSRNIMSQQPQLSPPQLFLALVHHAHVKICRLLSTTDHENHTSFVPSTTSPPP